MKLLLVFSLKYAGIRDFSRSDVGMVQLLFVSILFIFGCSLDLNISKHRAVIEENLTTQTENPSLIPGEKVTTTNGAEITATFGEIFQKVILGSGVEIDGVFYQ